MTTTPTHEITLPVDQLIITVRLPRMFKARLWLTCQLVWLAAVVSGFQAEFHIESR